MAIASKLPQLLLALRLLLQHFQPSLIPRALRRTLARLALIWSTLRTKLGFRQKGIGKSPPPSQDDNHRKPKARKDTRTVAQPKHIEHAEIAQLEHESISYTLTEQGEIISLDDVALSVYPFPGNIRANRSTHSLQSHMSAHNLAIIRANNASRSSQRLGSDHSHHSRNSNYSSSNHRASWTATAPHLNRQSRESPAWQQTAPTPHRQDTVPNLEVISPIEEVSPTGNAEVDSLRIPTRSPTPVFKALDDHRILPQMPEVFSNRRYDVRPRIRKKMSSITIEALERDFINPMPPSGWVRCVHPEGVRYFYNIEEKVYTESNLFDPKILYQVHEDIATIQNSLKDNQIDLSDTVLVLDVFYVENEEEPGEPKLKDRDSKDTQAFYHLADHRQRVIFFLDNYAAGNLYSWWEIHNATSETHLRCEIEAQYWFFIQLFPHALEMTSSMIVELRDITVFFIGDLMTSAYSNAPYTSENLYKILTLSSELEKNVAKVNAGEVNDNVGSMSLLARLMYIYCHTRFLNFHGEVNARLERNFSVYGDPLYRRTLLIKTLSLFLFSAPDFHLKTLQNMWVDGIMHKSVWEECVKKMSDEWQEFVFFATVMLNANVAFLAIQSVDVDSNPYRSPAQISSYLSVVANIGSIILGLLLMRQNRTKSRETADEARAFLADRNHPLLGLETLAILYSLPYALLMWGMILFLIAFCLMCFQNSSSATRGCIGSLCVAVAILVGWCVLTCWEKREEEPSIPSFADEEKPVADDSDCKGSMGSEKKETRLSRLFDGFLCLPSLLKVRKDSSGEEKMV